MFGLEKISTINGSDQGKNGSGGHQPLVEIRDLFKKYKIATGEFEVLKGIDLKLDRGEFVGILGKSGSGKSTLLNMITGIDHPTSGEVIVLGTPIHKLNENRISAWRGRHLGIVFQFFQLLPTLTLLENVMLPMDFCRLYTPRERRERAFGLLETVDLSEHAGKLPAAVSGGQQQRAAIARALANDPPVVIADEPTGNLDSKTAAAVIDLFEALVAKGKTVVMVTHDLSLNKRVSRSVLLADGEVVGDERHVFAQPQSPALSLA
jgi:putative ABC transport system ATP-binding protein